MMVSIQNILVCTGISILLATENPDPQLVSLDSSSPNTSYTYLLSLAKGNKMESRAAQDSPYSSLDTVVDSVGHIVKGEQEDHGFTSLSQKSAHSGVLETLHTAHTTPVGGELVTGAVLHTAVLGEEPELELYSTLQREGQESRIRPPSNAGKRRTQPHDIIGFSAVRASGFSRVGESRIYFKNTVTDSGWGWDRAQSVFLCHSPGLHYFAFSVKADADQGDNYKYEVSLMKNGDEVVSVGGAVDPSHRNSGTSASSSIILDLVKEDRVWLQLVRGNLVETKNTQTGYSSFSGHRLGCMGHTAASGEHLQQVIVEDLEEDPLQNVEAPGEVVVDRLGWYRPDSSIGDSDRNMKPHVYNEDRLYDAFEYDRKHGEEAEEDLRPSHRPFDGSGPGVMEHSNSGGKDEGRRKQPGLDRWGTGSADSSSTDRYITDRYTIDRYSADRLPTDKYSTDRLPTDKYSTDRLPTDKYSTDRLPTDKYYDEKYSADRYSADKLPKDKYSTDRIPTDRYSSDRYSTDRYSGDKHSTDRYSGDKYATDIYSPDRYAADKYPTDRYSQYDKYSPDRYDTGDRYETSRLPTDRHRHSDTDRHRHSDTDRHRHSDTDIHRHSDTDRHTANTGQGTPGDSRLSQGELFFLKREIPTSQMSQQSEISEISRPHPEAAPGKHLSYGK